MRVIGEIPHNEMKITLFYMNQKYLIKFELNGLEQIYKISEFDYFIKTVDEVKSAITQDFIHRVSLIFDEMQNNLSEALKDYC